MNPRVIARFAGALIAGWCFGTLLFGGVTTHPVLWSAGLVIGLNALIWGWNRPKQTSVVTQPHEHEAEPPQDKKIS